MGPLVELNNAKTLFNHWVSVSRRVWRLAIGPLFLAVFSEGGNTWFVLRSIGRAVGLVAARNPGFSLAKPG